MDQQLPPRWWDHEAARPVARAVVSEDVEHACDPDGGGHGSQPSRDAETGGGAQHTGTGGGAEHTGTGGAGAGSGDAGAEVGEDPGQDAGTGTGATRLRVCVAEALGAQPGPDLAGALMQMLHREDLSARELVELCVACTRLRAFADGALLSATVALDRALQPEPTRRRRRPVRRPPRPARVAHRRRDHPWAARPRHPRRSKPSPYAAHPPARPLSYGKS